MARVTIRENNDTRTYRLQTAVTTIGRGPTNHIQILDVKSSREHCLIERADKGYKLVDLESQNGTTVNGQRVRQVFLADGDKVEIGEVCLTFELEPVDRQEGASASSVRPRVRAHALKRLGLLPVRRRRLSLPGTPRESAEPVPEVNLEEALRHILEAYVQEAGPQGLDEAATVLDEFYLEKAGAARLDYLVESRQKLLKLLEITRSLGEEPNLRRLLDGVLDAVIGLTGAERGFVILVESDGRMTISVARNFDREAVKRPEFKFSHSIAEQVIRTGEPVITADAQEDRRLLASVSVGELKLRSVLCLPLGTKQKVVGCMYVDNRFESGIFTPETFELLSGFSEHAALAIEKIRLIEELEKKQQALAQSLQEVQRLNTALEEKVERQSQELHQAQEVVRSAQRQLELKYSYQSIVGRSPKIQEIFHLLDRVTESDVPVLIEGESGTGKELVARAIHFNGPRKRASFVSLNCAAIPETLLESELFGHVRGAFTGATSDRKGLFELAHEGTLFMDEIGDMSLEMQAKLLRALQEGEIRRVGGKDVIKVNARIISASNKDLTELLKLARFREDLYYRLNVVRVRIPPLRERAEDIVLLVDHFLDEWAKGTGSPKKEISREVLRLMMSYSWPGNVRELANEVSRMCALAEGNIELQDVKEEIRTGKSSAESGESYAGRPLKDIVRDALERVEKEAIQEILCQTGWRKSETARILGISRPTLDAKIEAYGLRRVNV